MVMRVSAALRTSMAEAIVDSIDAGVCRHTSAFIPPDVQFADSPYDTTLAEGSWSIETSYTGEVQAIALGSDSPSLQNDMIQRSFAV